LENWALLCLEDVLARIGFLSLSATGLPNDTVAMLVAPEHVMKASGSTVIQSAGIALHSHNEGVLHFVTWNNRG
jgi:hypothetical protein